MFLLAIDCLHNTKLVDDSIIFVRDIQASEYHEVRGTRQSLFLVHDQALKVVIVIIILDEGLLGQEVDAHRACKIIRR